MTPAEALARLRESRDAEHDAPVRGDRGGLLQAAVDKRAARIRAWWACEATLHKEGDR